MELKKKTSDEREIFDICYSSIIVWVIFKCPYISIKDFSSYAMVAKVSQLSLTIVSEKPEDVRRKTEDGRRNPLGHLK